MVMQKHEVGYAVGALERKRRCFPGSFFLSLSVFLFLRASLPRSSLSFTLLLLLGLLVGVD